MSSEKENDVLTPQGEKLNNRPVLDRSYEVFIKHGFVGDRDQFEAMFINALIAFTEDALS